MDWFKTAVANALAEHLNAKEEDIRPLLETPPRQDLGDLAFPCFTLAKQERTPPASIAARLASKLHAATPPAIERVAAHGPYVNFSVNKDLLAKKTLSAIYEQGRAYGRKTKKKPPTIAIEFPGPNTNKPLHVGHLRNILLGTSTANLLEHQGNIVKRVNINNDRGIHICKSMLAYQKWGRGKEPDKKPDHFVGDFYVLYAQKAKDNPQLEEEAKALLRKWEAGDAQVRALWKKLRGWALQGFQETYQKLGVTFDKEYFESDIYAKGKAIIEKGLATGVFVKDENGAVVAKLDDEGLPDKYVLRADGTSVYMTQDIYLAFQRYEDFHMDKMVYVVASEQDLHFKQLFAILKKLNYPKPDGLYHLSYGMVNLPEGKMKSREGTVIDLDDLFEEMQALAKQEITKRHDLDKNEILRRANILATGAINFFMLKYDRHKDILFDKNAAISFEGETGPYVQYTHARIASIFRKSGAQPPSPPEKPALRTPVEQAVLKKLAMYPCVVEDAAEAYRPELLTRYLFELSQDITAFYHECPVLQAEAAVKTSRLALLHACKIVLQAGLALIGIEAPEEM
ncbi:arginine--tRNA ligase [Candidatus Woesearchaeota archaeon]|nr:MAG: arginine--tRNA ligase [Candidatus Woesearchaeota archaeon]